MKQKTRWHDALVLAAVLCAAFLIVTGTQQITGRIDGVASMVFVLAVFLISIYTDGYVLGVVASLIGVLAVNFAFRSPYFAFNFTLPENLFSGMAMLVVSIMTSTLTTRIKKQEQLRMESETEKMRATLLRAVSHDLRTPLTGIIGNSSLFLESQEDLSSTEQRMIMTNIYEDSNWLLNMVENLLSVTRIQGDSLSINTTEEPVEEVVGEALEKLKKRYPDAAIRVKIPEEFLMNSVLVKFKKRYPNQKVTVSIPDEFISIPMDAVLIEQVTINLLENAIVHSGSILPIDFIVEDHPEHVSFIVRDYGKGLSEEKLQNLFETGTYNNSRSSDSRKGMGIGLSICKTIITAHHGTLSGRNHADGAEFCFTLPKAEALASEK